MSKEKAKKDATYKAPNPSKDVKKLLIDLCKLDGPSGFETEVGSYVKNYINDLKLDVVTDNLGSVVGHKKGKGKGPKILIAGHLDEIGFVVTKIEDSGYIRMTAVGGWWSHTLLSQKMCITTRKGKKIYGIVGSTPPHILPREKVMRVRPLKDIYLDLGCKSKADVEKAGIRIGDPITPYTEPFLGLDENTLFAKAIDNRVGTAIALLLLKRLIQNKRGHWADVYAGATVQEEVGLRGAKTLAYEINPDIAIALDVTISSDHIGMEKGDTIMGDGVAISILDRSTIGNPQLIRYLEDLAIKNKIPYMFDALTGGGTDAGAFHLSRSGVITVTLSTPTRYIHSHYAVCHLGDIEATVQLLEQFILSLTNETYKKLLV